MCLFLKCVAWTSDALNIMNSICLNNRLLSLFVFISSCLLMRSYGVFLYCDVWCSCSNFPVSKIIHSISKVFEFYFTLFNNCCCFIKSTKNQPLIVYFQKTYSHCICQLIRKPNTADQSVMCVYSKHSFDLHLPTTNTVPLHYLMNTLAEESQTKHNWISQHAM